CSPAPVNFSPCCAQVEPERLNTHTAPLFSLSPGAPITAVSPCEDRATPSPKRARCPTKQNSLPSGSGSQWDSEVPPPTSFPTRAMLPFDESATLGPVLACPISSVGISSACCV